MHRSVEWNKQPKYKPTHLWSINLQQRSQEYTMEKRYIFNTWCCQNWTTTCKRMKFKHFTTPHIQIKWFKNLSAKWHHKTRQKHTLFEISLNNIFLVLSPQARETKAKINKWDLIKTKSFCTTKETLKKSHKETYTMGYNICERYVL